MISINTSKLLRGIAILVVLASHLAGWMYMEPANPLAREIIMQWGPWGVDIFFAMSGYGLVKSGLKSDNYWHFVLKRLSGVYFPYLIVYGMVMLLQGRFKDITGSEIFHYLTGYELWFMMVLFIIYIIFLVVWLVDGTEQKWISVIVIPIMISGLTAVLHRQGMADFWGISNAAFICGLILAWAEQFIKKDKLTAIVCIVTGGLGFIMSLVLGGGFEYSGFGINVSANAFFAILILGIGILIKFRTVVFELVGTYSLYIYILQTGIFWPLMMKLTMLRYSIAAMITGVVIIVVACLVGWLLESVKGRLIRNLNK